MKNDVHDLGLVLDSKVRLIVIESWDETRVLQTLASLAVKRGLGYLTWTATDGLRRLGMVEQGEGVDSSDPETVLKLIKHDRQPNLYILCDFHPSTLR